MNTLFIPSAHAAVNDFTITDYQIDYYLSRDAEHRSRLKTVERITAQFPEINQNHGIERAIPHTYDKHQTHLTVLSVTNEQSQPISYSTYDSGDNDVLRIGDAQLYVHGLHTYVITYTQQDVTRYFADNGRDEFYWDTNGTDWRVPIQQLSATLHMDSGLGVVRQNLGQYCYIGAAGSNERCAVSSTYDDDNGAATTVKSGRPLLAGENVTIAVGFQKGTFTAYQPSLIERLTGIWAIITALLIPVALCIIGWMTWLLNRLTNRPKELGTIVPEYLPPHDASVTASARIASGASAAMTAQLLDLAVRHYIRIYEVKAKALFSPAQYEIEGIADTTGLKPEEQEILKDMFNGRPAVGSRLNLKTLRNNSAFGVRLSDNNTKLSKLIQGNYGLQEKLPHNVTKFRRIALVLGVIGVVFLSLPLLFAALFAFIYSFMVWSLTDKGLALKRYLEGLKLYIKVAETERIKMLQSPEGAEKVAAVANGTEPAQLIKLYERVLPYAVLFGEEKNWSKQLGAYYEGASAQPDWYQGNNGVFNAAVFATSVNSFSSSASVYTGSSSSSSSGSGGGGFSGGGGGGGGGGGW